MAIEDRPHGVILTLAAQRLAAKLRPTSSLPWATHPGKPDQHRGSVAPTRSAVSFSGLLGGRFPRLTLHRAPCRPRREPPERSTREARSRRDAHAQ